MSTKNSDLTELDRLWGLVVLTLLDERDTWVKRRVEHVTLESPYAYNRRVSVDFAIPDKLPSPLKTSDGKTAVYLVPLALMRKGPLSAFSVWSESGASLKLATRDEARRVAAAVLIALARRNVGDLADKNDLSAPAGVEQLVWEIVGQQGDDTMPVKDRVRGAPGFQTDPPAESKWRHKLASDADFLALAADLAHNFLLLVEVAAAPGERRLVKYTYEQRRDPALTRLPAWADAIRRAWLRGVQGRKRAQGIIALERERIPSRPLDRLRRLVLWWPYSLVIEAPSASQGGSYHLEVTAPEGLQITRAALQSLSPATNLRTDQLAVSRAHLHTEGLPVGTPVRAIVNIRPLGQTIVRTATLSSAVTTALLAVVFVRRGVFDENFGALQGLLLSVPLALSAYVARSGEAQTTSSVLYGLRVLTVISGLLSLLSLTVLAAGRACSATSTRVIAPRNPAHPVVVDFSSRHCETWWGTTWLLGAFLIASAAVLIILLRTTTFVARPPERRPPSGFPNA